MISVEHHDILILVAQIRRLIPARGVGNGW
jgi:hypothetical protein